MGAALDVGITRGSASKKKRRRGKESEKEKERESLRRRERERKKEGGVFWLLAKGILPPELEMRSLRFE